MPCHLRMDEVFFYVLRASYSVTSLELCHLNFLEVQFCYILLSLQNLNLSNSNYGNPIFNYHRMWLNCDYIYNLRLVWQWNKICGDFTMPEPFIKQLSLRMIGGHDHYSIVYIRLDPANRNFRTQSISYPMPLCKAVLQNLCSTCSSSHSTLFFG